MNKKQHKLVEVEWLDHWGSSSWTSASEQDCTPVRCVTVGYLVKETRDGVLIASTLDGSGKIVGVQFRARKLITRMRRLR